MVLTLLLPLKRTSCSARIIAHQRDPRIFKKHSSDCCEANVRFRFGCFYRALPCWTRPAGGFCCWLTLPRVPADFHQRALRQGMAFTPGDVFLVQPDENTHVRLCFSGLSPDLIREAITILGRLVEETTLPSPRVRGLPHALPLV